MTPENLPPDPKSKRPTIKFTLPPKAKLEPSVKQPNSKQEHPPSKPKNRRPEINLIIDSLIHNHPTVFNKDTPQPLAIHIEKEIHQAYPDWIMKSIKPALAIWVHRTAYLKSLIESTMRYHLNGSEAQPILPNHQEHANQYLALKQTRKAKQKKKKNDYP